MSSQSFVQSPYTQSLYHSQYYQLTDHDPLTCICILIYSTLEPKTGISSGAPSALNRQYSVESRDEPNRIVGQSHSPITAPSLPPDMQRNSNLKEASNRLGIQLDSFSLSFSLSLSLYLFYITHIFSSYNWLIILCTMKMCQ